MPEGPEIRRAADTVESAIAGHVIKHVELPHKKLAGQEDIFLGYKVLGIKTHGKAMLTRLSSHWTVYSHNQLYGRWTADLKGKKPSSNRSLRLAITAGDYTARLWSATDVDLIPTEEEEHHPFIAGLGPDVLSPDVTDEILCNQLDSATCRGRKAASLMLDQRAFAGLGNYLRSEILFVSGIHPDDRPCDLSRQDIENWAHAIRTLGIRSYKTGGITVAKHLEQAGKASGLPRSNWRHYVFNRVGKRCPNCGETIVRKRYGGRRLDFCQYCQPGRR